MPNRILHERICSSETIARLAPEQEVFFYRLLVQCDDYGRFDARPSILRARCYPLSLDTVTEKAVSGWLKALERSELVTIYEVDGKPYLQVVTWERYQQTRAKNSKFPEPPASASTCNQMLTHVPVSGIVNRESISGIRESISGEDAAPASAGHSTNDEKSGDVQAVYEYFKARIQPSSRTFPRDRIKARLKTFGVEELKAGIDHFADDWWWMQNNGTRGAPWFFKSDAQSEQFMNLVPRSESEHNTNGRASNGKPEPYSQRRHI